MKEALIPTLLFIVFILIQNVQNRSMENIKNSNVSLERVKHYSQRKYFNLTLSKYKFENVQSLKEKKSFCHKDTSEKLILNTNGIFEKTPIRKKWDPQPRGFFIQEGDLIYLSWISSGGKLESFRTEYILNIDSSARPMALSFMGQIYQANHCN